MLNPRVFLGTGVLTAACIVAVVAGALSLATGLALKAWPIHRDGAGAGAFEVIAPAGPRAPRGDRQAGAATPVALTATATATAAPTPLVRGRAFVPAVHVRRGPHGRV